MKTVVESAVSEQKDCSFLMPLQILVPWKDRGKGKQAHMLHGGRAGGENKEHFLRTVRSSKNILTATG